MSQEARGYADKEYPVGLMITPQKAELVREARRQIAKAFDAGDANGYARCLKTINRLAIEDAYARGVDFGVNIGKDIRNEEILKNPDLVTVTAYDCGLKEGYNRALEALSKRMKDEIPSQERDMVQKIIDQLKAAKEGEI